VNYALDRAIASAWSALKLDEAIMPLHGEQAKRGEDPAYAIFDLSDPFVEGHTNSADGSESRRRIMVTVATFTTYCRGKSDCGKLALRLSKSIEADWLAVLNGQLADFFGSCISIDYLTDASELQDDDEWAWMLSYEIRWSMLEAQ